MIKSIAESTTKQYKSVYSKWIDFCKNNSYNPLNSQIPTILNFLTLLYKSGHSYSSLNNARSALSLIMPFTDGMQVGNHPLVVRLIKAIGKMRPPRPRYKAIWDINLVLNKFIEWGDNGKLSSKFLTYKVLGLLAIITGHRVQTFSLIKIDNITISGDLVNIKISGQIKTSKPGSFQPNLIVPSYPANLMLCPVKALQDYLNRTKSVRTDSQLFISYESPYKKIDKQTLSRWLKSLLKESGIDTSLFKAHSVRHASTSKAYTKGVNIDVIMDSAGWTRNSKVFGKFYRRDIVDRTEYSMQILDM